MTYGPEADVFAVGVLSYEVLCGISPFDAQDLNGMLGQIEKGPRYPDHLSDAAVGFLRQCLYADAGKRADSECGGGGTLCAFGQFVRG